MILSELKDYLRQHQRAVLVDMANRFDIEPEALRIMLERWVQKGKVRKYSGDGACHTGCCKCDPTQLEWYEWVEAEDKE